VRNALELFRGVRRFFQHGRVIWETVTRQSGAAKLECVRAASQRIEPSHVFDRARSMRLEDKE